MDAMLVRAMAFLMLSSCALVSYSPPPGSDSPASDDPVVLVVHMAAAITFFLAIVAIYARVAQPANGGAPAVLETALLTAATIATTVFSLLI
jgi:hypothetical protein